MRKLGSALDSVYGVLHEAAADRTRLTMHNPILILLLVTDLFIVAAHVLNSASIRFADPDSAFGRMNDSFFSIAGDRGFGEAFQYLKFFWVAAALMLLVMRNRQLIYGCWSALFGYLLVDDLFEVHESFGLALSQRFNFPAILGLRPVDIGELAVTATVGAILLTFIAIGHLRASRSARTDSTVLVALLFALSFFGVVVDMVHVILLTLGVSAYIEWFVALVEDGGEMVVASLMSAFVLARAYPRPSGQAPDHSRRPDPRLSRTPPRYRDASASARKSGSSADR